MARRTVAKKVPAKRGAKGQNYTADDIQVHEGLEGVRLNPGMYLGALGDSMVFRMVKEAVDNWYDEFAAGRNTGGEVVYHHKENAYVIADYAGGIPIELKQTKHEGKVSTLTLIMTKLHAGGKFDSSAYETSSGTHGVGIAATNAASEYLEVWTQRSKVWYYQKFVHGKPVAKLKKIGTRAPKAFNDMGLAEKNKAKYGTIIKFVPDQTVVSEDAARGARKKAAKDLTVARISIKQTGTWLYNLAMLNPGLKVSFTYAGKGTKVYENKKGLEWLVKQRATDNELSSSGKPFVYEDDRLSLAITWTDHYDDEYFTSYVNSSPTVEHGTHVEGFRAALSKAITPHIVQPKGRGKKISVSVQDMMIGACGVLNWKMNSAVYSSQVKDKLVSKVNKEVQDKIEEALVKWFAENSRIAKNIIKKAQTANKAREDLKTTMKNLTEIRKGNRTKMPDNLVEAPNVKPEEREIYIVEGDSAGGTAKNARNSHQEVLKLSGKIANSLSKKMSDLLSSQAVRNLIIAMGVDPGTLDVKAVNPTFGVDKLRCAKVYLLSDADPDGSHINTLLLSFFFRFMPEFIKQGRLYVVEGSLFIALWKGTLYKGDTFEEVAKQLPDTAEARRSVKRLKGWGEANAEELDKIAFDAETREISQIEWVDDPERIQYFRHIAAESPAHKRELLGLKSNRTAA